MISNLFRRCAWRLTRSPRAWYDERRPEVTLVVLNYHAAATTAACLRSIWSHAVGRRYELLVVDVDGSAQDSGLLRELEGPFRVLRLREYRSPEEAVELAVETARAPRVVIVDRETRYPPGWLAKADFRNRPANAPRTFGKPRAALYSSFLMMPGGGTKYLLAFAETLQDRFDIDLLGTERWSRRRVSTVARELGLSLNEMESSSYPRASAARRYDFFAAMGNEMLPPVPAIASRNFYICQFPYPMTPETRAARRENLKGYERVIVYSPFAKRCLEKRWAEAGVEPIPVEIVEPAVDAGTPDAVIPPEGRSGILSVGMFSFPGPGKRQDAMIRAFRRVADKRDDVELHLAGGLVPLDAPRAHYEALVRSASGLRVRFHPDCPREELRALYATSLVYWHASGLDVDPETAPEDCEHFGITPLEAMAAGAIPLVVGAGGPAENIEDGISGFHYSDVDQLCERTLMLLEERRSDRVRRMQAEAVEVGRRFTATRFRGRVSALLASPPR